MTNEELQLEVDKLTGELEELRRLFYKDNFSDLEIFRKKIQFMSYVGFYGTTPITQAAAIGAPTAPGATYSQAEAQSAVTAINSIRTVLKNLGLTA